MAFQRDTFSSFFNLLKTIQGSHLVEERALAESFILEERLTEAREDSYARCVSSPQDMDDWNYLGLPEKVKIGIQRPVLTHSYNVL